MNKGLTGEGGITMNINYFVVPGKILKEYMDSRNITQKEMAKMASSSERHLSEVINGKTKITEKFALKLESVFPDVKAEFWLDLEAQYRLYLLRNKVYENNTKQIIHQFKLMDVFKGYNYNENEMVKELFNIAGVNNERELEKEVNNLANVMLMHDSGNKYTIFLWLKLCEEQIDIQNEISKFSEFNIDNFKQNYTTIKKLLNTNDYSMALKNVRKFLNKFGIGLVLEESIPTSKVRGAVTLYSGHPMIYLSTRHKRIDAIYFALIHEVYHIINEDYLKSECVISYEEGERELISNESIKTFFIADDKFRNFVSEGKFSEENIIIFARKQGVVTDIVIGRLQHEGYIEYNEHTRLRTYVDKEVIDNVV